MEFPKKHLSEPPYSVNEHALKKFKPEPTHWEPFMILLSSPYAFPTYSTIHQSIGIQIMENPEVSQDYLQHFLNFACEYFFQIPSSLIPLVVSYVTHTLHLVNPTALKNTANSFLAKYVAQSSQLSQDHLKGLFEILQVVPENIEWNPELSGKVAKIALSTFIPTLVPMALRVFLKPGFLSTEALISLKPLLVPLLRSMNSEVLQYAIPMFAKCTKEGSVSEADVLLLQDLLKDNSLKSSDTKFMGEVVSQIISLFGSLVESFHGFDSKFVEPLFTFVCRNIQNFSKKVRQSVCRVLPKFAKTGLVSTTLLLQTLDKTEFTALSQISPRGTFIQALDDEYHVVREAGIEAICEIGEKVDEFAKKSIKLLLGMLNDEADETRIVAVKALRKVSKGTKLSSYELGVVTFSIQEKNLPLREAFYELFSIIKLNKPSLLLDLIKPLRGNLKRYPQDKMLIYQCGAKLGSSYAEFVKANAMIIMQHDPNYLIREREIDEPTHVFHVIMQIPLRNRQDPVLFLQVLLQNNDYLRHKHPDLVPELFKKGLEGLSLQEAPKYTFTIPKKSATEFYYEKILEALNNPNIPIIENITCPINDPVAKTCRKIYKAAVRSLNLSDQLQKAELLPHKILLNTIGKIIKAVAGTMSVTKQLDWNNFLFTVFIRSMLAICLLLPEEAARIIAEVIELINKYGREEKFAELIEALTDPYRNKQAGAYAYLTEKPLLPPPGPLDTQKIKHLGGKIIFPKLMPQVIEFDHTYPVRLQLAFSFMEDSSRYCVGVLVPGREVKIYNLAKKEYVLLSVCNVMRRCRKDIVLQENAWVHSEQIQLRLFVKYKKYLRVSDEIWNALSKNREANQLTAVSETYKLTIWPK